MTVGQTPAEAAPPALADDFRNAMRRLASGVAIATTRDASGQRYGIVMTAVMSLSMEPPSLLLAVHRKASLCDPLLERGYFGVSLLADAHHRACRDFVAAPADARFNVGDWDEGPHHVPLLRAALAQIVCRVDQAEPFGSHMVIRGIVETVYNAPHSDALLFLDGRYGRMTSYDE